MKIVITVVVGIISVSLAVSFIVVNISKDIFVDTFSRSQEKVFEQIGEDMDDFHSNLTQIMSAIDQSWAFRYYLNHEEMDSVESFETIYQMKKHLQSAIPSNIEDISILVVGLNGKTYINSAETLTTPVEEILNSDITKRALKREENIVYQYSDKGYTATMKDSPTIIATKALSYLDSNNPYAVVYISIKETNIAKFYDYFSNQTNDIIIVDQNAKVVSSNKKEYINQEEKQLTGSASSMNDHEIYRKVVTYHDKSVTLLMNELPYFNFKILGVIDNEKAVGNLYDISKIVIICAMITAVVLIVIFFIIQQTTKPLSVLVKRMAKVRGGDFDQYVKVQGSEEILQLSQTFNFMLEDLNRYVAELIEVQKEKRKAEIRALQMQINPHYIFNTLSSVKWLIWQNDPEKSVKIIDAFILLLRNTISNTDEFITVGQEIENLRNYVLINETRYGSHIKVDYFIMPECESYLLPKLILQPFIENAFFHGFPNGQKGNIQIFVQSLEDEIRFEIMDDGIGMEEEKLTALLSKKKVKTDHFTGIGINNVDDRIKLIYGSQYGIHIESSPGRGTTIVVTLGKHISE